MNRYRFLSIIALLVAACGGGDSTPDAAPEPDATIRFGNIQSSWTVNGVAGEAGCDTVGGSTVSIDAFPTNGGSGVPSVFQCSSGMGTTEPLPPGEYRLRFTLYPGNSSLGQLSQVMADGTFNVEDQQVTTGPSIDFTADTTGGFQAEFSSGAIGGNNCGSEDMGYAGITGISFQLTRDGVCVPTQLTVGDGSATGTTGGTFDLACPGPTELPCLEFDQTFRAEGLTAGDYQLEMIGLETAEPCYPRIATFTVYGANLVNDLGLLTAALDANNGNCVAP